MCVCVYVCLCLCVCETKVLLCHKSLSMHKLFKPDARIHVHDTVH